MKCMIAQNVISKFVSCLRTACVYFNIQCFFRCFPSCNRTDDAISVDFPSAQLCAVFLCLLHVCRMDVNPRCSVTTRKAEKRAKGDAGVTAARVYTGQWLCWCETSGIVTRNIVSRCCV